MYLSNSKPAENDADKSPGRGRCSRHKRLHHVQVSAIFATIGRIWIWRAAGEGDGFGVLVLQHAAAQAREIRNILEDLIPVDSELSDPAAIGAVVLVCGRIDASTRGGEDSLVWMSAAGVCEELLLQISVEVVHDGGGGIQGWHHRGQRSRRIHARESLVCTAIEANPFTRRVGTFDILTQTQARHAAMIRRSGKGSITSINSCPRTSRVCVNRIGQISIGLTQTVEVNSIRNGGTLIGRILHHI